MTLLDFGFFAVGLLAGVAIIELLVTLDERRGRR